MSLELLSSRPAFSPDDIVGIIVLATIAILYGLRGIWWDKADPLHYQWFERRQETVLGRKRQAENVIKDVASRVEKEQRDCVIFWGSQTGTAEGFARVLGRTLHQSLGLNCLVLDLAEINPSTISSVPQTKSVVFLLSTYGEGDPSDNAAKFYRWILHSHTPLTNLCYAGFGLGNSTYKNYNRVINTVTRRLDERGANRIGKIGLGDDGNGTTEDEYLLWEDEFVAALKSKFGYRDTYSGYDPSIKVSKVTDRDMLKVAHIGRPFEPKTKAGSSLSITSSCHPLQVLSSKNLTPKSTRRCLHLEIDISSHPELKYRTGDHCLVWPSNPEGEVVRLLRLLGLEEQRLTTITIEALNLGSALRVPSPCSIEVLFKHYLSICSPVSRQVLPSLAQIAPDEATKATILHLYKNKSDFEQIQSRYVTLAKFMETVINGERKIWGSVPISWVIENISPLQPRAYSISSSSIVSPRQISITAVVIEEFEGYGLATNMLDAIHNSLDTENTSARLSPRALIYDLKGPDNALENGKIFGQLRKSKFKLPIASASSIMMVAAGTGIASFRAFVLERSRLKSIGREIGKMSLFYGCRTSGEDFLYAEEFSAAQSQLGGEFEIVTAFSREQQHVDGRKIYIQDRLFEHASDVAQHLLHEGNFFYICGSASMAKNVTTAVTEIIRNATAWDNNSILSFLETAKRTRRWQEDVWG